MVNRLLIATVIGARPQFVKAGPVSREFSNQGVQEFLINTGQHYDPILSDKIAEDVGLRPPDLDLQVGSGTHGAQTAATLERVETVFLDTKPTAVVVYGDTNATIAGALAATKLHIPVVHIEAGLRSFNRLMPEEINRVATDHIADVLLAPTVTAMRNLESENLLDRSVLTGDVMVDAVRSIPLGEVELPEWATGRFHAATIHRVENTDDPDRLRAVLEALDSLEHPVHLLAHPRLQARIDEYGFDHGSRRSLVLHDPLPYAQMLGVIVRAESLLTDSGGLQKEAFILETPCITLRTETEWPETLEGGWNVVAGNRLDELGALIQRPTSPLDAEPFGDGRAAERIVEEILRL
jgi:UDP-N-acetylglucosamine 2-epimerase (non-hydrolysing)